MKAKLEKMMAEVRVDSQEFPFVTAAQKKPAAQSKKAK